jgi:DNA polymerase-3 subunit gamma/tau
VAASPPPSRPEPPAREAPPRPPAATSAEPEHHAASEPEQISPSPPAESAAAPGALDAAAIRRVWDDVLTAVRRRSVREWAVAREATVREVEGTTLVLLFRHQVHATMLSNNPKAVIDAVTELLGGKWDIRCEVPGADPPAQAQPPPAPPPAPPVAERAPVQRPPQQARARAEDDWPAAAVPGGGQAAAGATATRSATATAVAPPAAPPQQPAPAVAPPPAPAARPDRPERPTWDEEPPPYETEYGFDPGDEPIDDGAPAVRESSEEQALRLLREHLGAERID